MPNYVVTWALLGAVLIAVSLLTWTLSRALKFFRERARQEEAEDIKFERQVAQHMGRHRKEDREPRRKLWVVPVLGVLATMGGWARNHPGGIAAAAAAALGAAATAVLVATGASGHQAAEPPTPPAVVAPSPTSTAELPTGTSSTTSPPGGGTTRSVPLDPGTTQALVPPASMRTPTPIGPPVTTTSKPTTVPVPTSVTTVTRAPRCLLHLDALLGVCVSSG